MDEHYGAKPGGGSARADIVLVGKWSKSLADIASFNYDPLPVLKRERREEGH